MRSPLLGSLLLLACTGGRPTDTFVAGGGAIARWAESPDGKVKVPLAAGLSWSNEAPPKDTLIKAKTDAGPTVVVAAYVHDAPKPLALATCAEAHRARLAAALAAANILAIPPPTLGDELRKGQRVPRVHYAVPLEAKGNARPASTLSWWTYYVAGERCVAAGVTSVVRARVDDPSSPEPEDMQRFDRVYALVAEGTAVSP